MSSNQLLHSKASSDFYDRADTLFDFESFYSSIEKCLLFDSGDVILSFYVHAYEQLYKFFILLGGAFSFVAADVKNKIKILNEFQDAEKEKLIEGETEKLKEGETEKLKGSETKVQSNFSTVKTMVNYEKDMNLFSNSKYVSGSRTLLRLHRGLDFIRKFLDEIYKVEDNTKLGGAARLVYDSTLAEHHTWVVRNAARMAMQFLPTRKELLHKISQNNEEKLNNILEIFPAAIETVNKVYDIVQEIYSVNNILHLP